MKLKPRSMTGYCIRIIPVVLLLIGAGVQPLGATRQTQDEKEPSMRYSASGSFKVEITPQSQDERTGVAVLSLNKVFSGDFDGSSSGTMLTSFGDPQTSAVYVAIERLQGSLGSRAGSFVLVHRGIKSESLEELLLVIAPDSGSDELLGIEGTCQIEIKDGQHFYTIDYNLPE